LEAREPFRISRGALKHAGHAAAGAAGFAGTVAALNTQQRRDFDDRSELNAREPFGLGGIVKGVGKVVKNFIRDEEAGEVYIREFDDAESLDAREPEPFGLGGIVKGVGKVVKNFIRDDETGDIYYVREASNLDELD